MRSFAILGLLVLALVPLGAAGTPIGSGHIALGAPTTSAITTSEANAPVILDSFFVAAPAAGTVVSTQTVDKSGLPYDLDLYFWDADGNYLSDCATDAVDESCAVPAGAALVEVAAYVGVDLDVTVLAG